MNNNIIHADNPNSIGGYMFNAGNAYENTRRMIQRALGMICAKYRTTWAMLLMEPLNTVHSLVQDEWIMHMAVRSNTA